MLRNNSEFQAKLNKNIPQGLNVVSQEVVYIDVEP
jgi:hypothetical protein